MFAVHATATRSKTAGNATATEQWELADGGKTLKVHREAETQRGAQEWNYVFNKK